MWLNFVATMEFFTKQLSWCYHSAATKWRQHESHKVMSLLSHLVTRQKAKIMVTSINENLLEINNETYKIYHISVQRSDCNDWERLWHHSAVILTVCTISIVNWRIQIKKFVNRSVFYIEVQQIRNYIWYTCRLHLLLLTFHD